MQKTNISLVQISFFPLYNDLLVSIEKKPNPGDHESDDEITFLRLTNLIPYFTKTNFYDIFVILHQN